MEQLQVEQKLQRLEELEGLITEELFNEWKDHPITEYCKLNLEIKLQGREDFLKEASYINEEKGLLQAAEARGLILAYKDMLDISWEDE